MLPSGEVPHHFELDKPVFNAISGSRQTGPTIFWAKAALHYVQATADLGWLRKQAGAIRRAVGSVLRRWEAAHSLVMTDGSLLIDTFIRGNLTLDSNGMLISLLREQASAEDGQFATNSRLSSAFHCVCTVHKQPLPFVLKRQTAALLCDRSAREHDWRRQAAGVGGERHCWHQHLAVGAGPFHHAA